MTWLTFDEKNGVASLDEMRVRIRRYQAEKGRAERDLVIGCRLLQQPFFLPRDHWLRAPSAYPVNAVDGKSCRLDEPTGAMLIRSVEERLHDAASPPLVYRPGAREDAHARRFGMPQFVMPRLGQGTFRIAVLDGFDRRCSITGERALPILDAAHIKPWSAGGENPPGNGLLLRTDLHRLFDLGYVTVSAERRFEVSPRLQEDYENGKAYYNLHGRSLRARRPPLPTISGSARVASPEPVGRSGCAPLSRRRDCAGTCCMRRRA